MDPGARLLGARANLDGRIERAGVHIAGLNTNDGARVERGYRVGTHAALPVGRHPHHSRTAEPQQRERLQHGYVDFIAHHDGDLRRAEQAALLDVPTGAIEQRVPRRCQAREIGHGRAGHEARAGGAWQSQDLARPCQCDFFDGRGHRRHDPQRRILVPCSGQPVGGQRGGQGAADDETKIAAAGGGYGGRRAALIQQREHCGGGARVFRQRSAQIAETDVVGQGRDAAAGDGGEVAGRTRGSLGKQWVH
jgi:hypothetical protein